MCVNLFLYVRFSVKERDKGSVVELGGLWFAYSHI